MKLPWSKYQITLAAAAVALVVAYFLLSPPRTYQTDHTDAFQAADYLYRKSQQTRLSYESKNMFGAVVEERIACYQEHSFILFRSHNCNAGYVSGIIAKARANIKAMPEVGAFIQGVRKCPMVYAMCMGDNGGDSNKCLEMELKCIEYNLDHYWRGINIYRYYSHPEE